MEALPWALVGCGMMGARHLRGYGELERAQPGTLKLVAVCDADEARANAVADEAEELLGSRPQAVSSIAALPGLGVSACDVVTPNRTHDAVVCALLELGLDVLVEKPFAVTIERGRKMIDTAARLGRTLGVAENNRRDPTVRLAKYVVESGFIGTPTLVSQVSVNPGGKIIGTPWRHKLAMGGLPLDVWIHLAYGLETTAGTIESIRANTSLVEQTRPWTAPDGSTEDVVCEGVDTCAATLNFASGAVGTWQSSFASVGEGKFERTVYGTAGTLHAPSERSGKPVRVKQASASLEGDELVAAVPGYELSELESMLFGAQAGSFQLQSVETDRKLLAAEVGEFIEARAAGRQPEVPGELGLRSVALIYAMLESAHANREVAVSEVMDGSVRAYQDLVEAAG